MALHASVPAPRAVPACTGWCTTGRWGRRGCGPCRCDWRGPSAGELWRWQVAARQSPRRSRRRCWGCRGQGPLEAELLRSPSAVLAAGASWLWLCLPGFFADMLQKSFAEGKREVSYKNNLEYAAAACGGCLRARAVTSREPRTAVGRHACVKLIIAWNKKT